MNTLDTQEMSQQREISTTTIERMSKAAKWMRFTAIIGFIFCALMLIIALAIPQAMQGMGGSMGSMAAGGITAFYIIYAILLFIPNLFLFQSANSFSNYAKNGSANDLESAFGKLYSLYLFIGILFIIGIGFFVIGILGALAIS